ncbi:MAG: hypothetical protein JWP01_4289 [Myxococcales bacterium]|nr:hypothetical protein [Myxococcales bacterium]
MTLENTRRPQHDHPAPRETVEHAGKTEPDAVAAPKPDYDRVFSPGKGKSDPTGAAASGSEDDRVKTQWWINYQSVLGKTRNLPGRTGKDQMVVDELKIRPNGARSVSLQGGNMAKSGDVELGTAMVPRGAGLVTAAIRYAPKTSFDVKVELQPGATGSERANADKEATALVNALLRDRGDYDAIAAEVEAELAVRFPGKTLSVSIKPLAKGQATELFVAEGADYEATSDSKFAVMIEPTSSQDHATAWNRSTSAEEGSGESDQAAVKTTNDIESRKKTVEKEKMINTFKTSLATNVQDIFKGIEEQLDSTLDQHVTTHDKTVKWTVGLDPSKEKKDGEAEKSGVVDKLKGAWKTVSSVGKWVYSKGKNLMRRAPIVAAALELGGSIWDAVSGRGKISRESSESDGTSHTSGSPKTHKEAVEISSLASIATDLTTQMVRETEHDIEKEVATKLGTEISSTTKKDATKKQTVNTSSSGTTVIHEVGKPRISIKKLD